MSTWYASLVGPRSPGTGLSTTPTPRRAPRRRAAVEGLASVLGTSQPQRASSRPWRAHRDERTHRQLHLPDWLRVYQTGEVGKPAGGLRLAREPGLQTEPSQTAAARRADIFAKPESDHRGNSSQTGRQRQQDPKTAAKVSLSGLPPRYVDLNKKNASSDTGEISKVNAPRRQLGLGNVRQDVCGSIVKQTAGRDQRPHAAEDPHSRRQTDPAASADCSGKAI